MRTNPLREAFQSREIAYGAWLTIPSSVSAETVAVAGFEYVCVDMQHGLIGYPDVVPMLQALTTGATTATVRVPQNQPGFIGKALDAGAMAVIVPMVNSVEECEAAVAAARYAPAGSRSYGPTRVSAVEGPDYFERANADVAVIPMIETVEAVDAIDRILAVPGVDAIYVGPADLSVSLGYDPASNEPEFLDTLDRIVDACESHGVVPGIHTTTATAPDRLERGFRMVTVTNDVIAMRTAVKADLALVKGGGVGAEGSIY